MKTRIAAIATAAVLGMLLTGCAEAIGPEKVEHEVAVSSSESPTPLVAETPAPTEENVGEVAFITETREALGSDSQIPDATDEQLLAAGADACAQIAEGKSTEQVRVIEGESPDDLGWYSDSSKIASVAQRTLCD